MCTKLSVLPCNRGSSNEGPPDSGTFSLVGSRRSFVTLMRTFLGLFVLGGSLCLIGACRAQQPPEYRPTATVKDIMDSIVDPSADVLWDSVVTIVSAAGIEEKRPRTEEEWLTVRRSAVQLIEATNLLLIPGRHVARPGERAED